MMQKGDIFMTLLLFLGDAFLEEDEIIAKKVADHYSARTNQTLQEREASPIIHLKKLNNWVCTLTYISCFLV